MTLAPKLPYTHPFAGGYPRVGGQPLPTDPDAIDYLERVKAADGGAAVEVGVAMAVDAFVRGCKADGIWDVIKASCILCGARTISGALVPLVGTAPTAYSFASGDYDRSSGLKGDGSTKYLDSNRANDADGQDDKHLSVFVTTHHNRDATRAVIGSGAATTGDSQLLTSTTNRLYRVNFTTVPADAEVADSSTATGFWGASRSSSTTSYGRYDGTNIDFENNSTTPVANNISVFARGTASKSDARLAFYSIGSSLDLAALDNRVSTLVAAIAAAI